MMEVAEFSRPFREAWTIYFYLSPPLSLSLSI